MAVVLVTEKIFIDPHEVVSAEHDYVEEYTSGSISDHTTRVKFNGTRVILKNGRKVFIDKMMPDEVLKKLGLLITP